MTRQVWGLRASPSHFWGFRASWGNLRGSELLPKEAPFIQVQFPFPDILRDCVFRRHIWETQRQMLMLSRVRGREGTGISPPQVASMNQRRVDFYLASIEDMLVAVGGRNENGALSSVETYSPKTDSWSYVAGLPR